MLTKFGRDPSEGAPTTSAFLLSQKWRWPLGNAKPPTEGIGRAIAKALRHPGRHGQAGVRAEVLAHLAALTDPATNAVGSASVCESLAIHSSDVLAAAAEAVNPEVHPTDAAVTSAAALAAHVGAARLGAQGAAAVAASGLLASLVSTLDAPRASFRARIAVLSAVRRLAPYPAARHAVSVDWLGSAGRCHHYLPAVLCCCCPVHPSLFPAPALLHCYPRMDIRSCE